MKSYSHTTQSNEKVTDKYKNKIIKLDKKPNTLLRSEYAKEEISRPGSCPMNNSTWSPSRNWHKYLSGEGPNPLPPRPRSPGPSGRILRSPGPAGRTLRSPGPARKVKDLVPPQDELVTIKLPTVNFSSDPETPPGEQVRSINDLCDEDKVKIAQLVEELARCKQEKLEAEDRITTLKNKVSELKSSLNQLSDKHAEKKSFEMLKTLHLNEQTALKNQLSELNELLVRMQVQKATSDMQMKNISVQAEKMTRALHSLHRENTELQVELRVTKDKLGVAQKAVASMTKELHSVQERINPKTEDKACQSTENISFNRVNMKSFDVSEPLPEDHHILKELFFNKGLNNNFSPKETVIFLPSDEINSKP